MKLTKISSAVLALTAVIFAATAASAQVMNSPTTSVQKPFAVKVGVLFPNTENANHYGGSDQLSVGVDYSLAKTTNENPSIPSIYADFAGGSRNGGHIDSTGVGVAVRSFTNSANSSITPYAGAGTGVYYESGNKDNSTKTNFGVGGKIFLGADIAGGFFVEGNYQFLPSVDGINPSGFGLQGGLRF